MMRLLFITFLVCSMGYSQAPYLIPENRSVSKTAFGSQFYNFYNINVHGIEYKYLYLSDDKKIEVVTTKDPKFTINGKNFWDIPYKNFSKEQQQGYCFIYGFYFVKFDDGWFGCYGKYQPSHLIENNQPYPPNDEKPSFFVKTNLLK